MSVHALQSPAPSVRPSTDRAASPVRAATSLRPGAVPADASAALPPAGEYLHFELAGERYAVDILAVTELRNYEAPVRMANAPSYLLGIVELRGTVIPIIDLRLRLGLPAQDYDASTSVIVTTVHGQSYGVVADRVTDVARIEVPMIKRVPRFGNGSDLAWVKAVATLEPGGAGKPVLIVDFVQLLGREPVLDVLPQAA